MHKTTRLVIGLIIGTMTPFCDSLMAQESSQETSQESGEVGGDQSILSLIDVPLMPGLEELIEAGVLFDKPDGRYVEIELVGGVSLTQAHDFYKATLGNWGWVAGSDSRDKTLNYTKDGEDLLMEFSESDDALLVKIRLKPIG